ncbi:MAG TPA: tetratricopeptide repeat protein [Pyrinomonadaceae bacterium]|nr:tetratricopeptide repeat protein [Pyrinomonadaceae bacterium]
MRANAILRGAGLIAAALCVGLSGSAARALAQDVGADVGGGVFRAKNPETKKKTATKPAATTAKPGTKATGTTRVRPSNVEDKIEEWLDKGNQARDARQFTEAEDAYKEVLKLKARDARGAYGLGNVYSDQRRWDEAEAAYRNSVAWAPNNADAHVALSVVLVQPRAGGDNAKRFADAEAFARKSVQIDPKNAVGWDRLGVALQARGIVNSETEHSYRRAIDLDPQFAVAYAHLARTLTKVGKGSEAPALYDKAIELAKDPGTLNLIAESLQGEQLWPQSEPVLKKALDMDSKNPTSLLLMGRYLVVYKRFQEAEPYLRSATEVSSRAFQPFNLLGRAYLGMDRFSDAEATYERASSLAAEGERKQLAGIFGFEGVGDGYLKARQKENAVRAYQRALDLDPGNNGIAQKLARARAN